MIWKWFEYEMKMILKWIENGLGLIVENELIMNWKVIDKKFIINEKE